MVAGSDVRGGAPSARVKLKLHRAPFLAAAMLSLAYGVWMGLLRLGWALPLPWPDQLILHGPLMVGGFLGTLIGIERAVGLGRRWAYAAPFCTAAGSLALVLGPPGPAGPMLITGGSLVVVAVFVSILLRHTTAFTGVMLAAAMSWALGNGQWLAGASIHRVVFWWIAFVVLTIAGERLELNRVMRPSPAALTAFACATALVMAGAFIAWARPAVGSRVIGAGLVAVSVWLGTYDIARRTIRQRRETRFIAVCLLSGYAWLAVGGTVAFATGAALPGTAYDAVLHAVFLGFAFAMIFGHALIVFPAILGAPMPFTRAFYGPLIALHASVALRLIGDFVESLARLRAWGGLLNAAALLTFVVVVLWIHARESL
jgi:hypothetical protein